MATPTNSSQLDEVVVQAATLMARTAESVRTSDGRYGIFLLRKADPAMRYNTDLYLKTLKAELPGTIGLSVIRSQCSLRNIVEIYFSNHILPR
jgi:hypothetical protein